MPTQTFDHRDENEICMGRRRPIAPSSSHFFEGVTYVASISASGDPDGGELVCKTYIGDFSEPSAVPDTGSRLSRNSWDLIEPLTAVVRGFSFYGDRYSLIDRDQVSRSDVHRYQTGRFIFVCAGLVPTARAHDDSSIEHRFRYALEGASLPTEKIHREVVETPTASSLTHKFIAGLAAANARNEDDAIEFVYAEFYKLVENRNFPAIDGVLNSLNVEKFKTSVLLSILTATAMGDVRKKLRGRSDFYARVRDCIIRREAGANEADELLFGLD